MTDQQLVGTNGQGGDTGHAQAMQAFTFGDPEPVLDRAGLTSHMETWRNGKWYEPPISLAGLTRAFRVAPHHSSAIILKRNLLLKTFEPSRWLDRQIFGRLVLDYLVLGNGYLEQKDNLAGRPLRFAYSPALHTRVGVEPGTFFFVRGWLGEHEFPKDKMFHLAEPDVAQEIYGVPEYMGAIQAGLLNENATLFRRRYFLNGSHAGFILYMNEASVNEEDAEALREALKSSKGPGNFRNLFIHAPNGKKDGVQLIPISEVAARDEFTQIKNVTRDDMLAAHRVPPQLLGVVPNNTGGFGGVAKAAEVFFRNEIEPLHMRLLELNEWAGVEAISFGDYQPIDPVPGR